MTKYDINDLENRHLHRNVKCGGCQWIGVTGELIAGSKPGLRCPRCDSDDIKHLLSDAPERIQ